MKAEVRSTPCIGHVRVVAELFDPYEGLKGHDYIAARNLAPLVERRVQTSAQQPVVTPAEVSK